MTSDQDPYSFDAPPQPSATTAAPTNPWTPEELAQSQQFANDYVTQHQIPSSYGTPDDIANSYVQFRRAGMSHADAMAKLQTVPAQLGWEKAPAPDPGTGDPPAPPVPGPDGGTGGTTAGTGSLTQPFTTPYVPAGSASPNPNPLPTVAGSLSTIPGAPAFPTIPKFTAPTMDEAMNDPGYKFVLDQGNNNLQNWASARGTLNDSSTAKALIDYGQGAATTQYGNVWDRALRGYEENVGTQYMQPWQAAFQNWQTGTANPTMQNFSTNAANVSHLNDVNWQDAWNAYLDKENIFRDQRDSTFSKQFQVATA